jgi:hypothetical protein
VTPPHLHVLGIDPGGTTGWALLTVPRGSIYGTERGRFIGHDWGQFYGAEPDQAEAICRLVREIQSLDYKIGPAVVIEDFQLNTHVRGEELLSPVRLAAMIRYASHLRRLGDARVILQHRQIAKTTATDERLQAWGLYHKGEEHARDATRHAVTAIRRAKASPELRSEMWNAV